MTVTYTTDGGLVGVSFLSAAEGGSGGLDGGFGGGGGLPSFGRTLLAELTSSLILDEGTGGPTWSRATKAWGFNELGYLEELASGCAFFGGARLVRNLVPTPSTTLAVAGTKTVTLTQAATLQFSMGAGAGTATFSGTGGASGTLAAGASRVSVNKTVTAGTFIVTASVDALIDLSIVDVTGYDSSYVPEYVSVGVEASPHFGAGIDGAKYFETDWQGAPIAAANLLGFRRETAATNNLLWSRDLRAGGSDTPRWKANTIEPELITNGDFSADSAWVKGTGWTISGGTANFAAGTASRLTLAGVATIGKTYIVTFTVVSVSGSYVALELGNSSGPGSISAAGTYSIQLVCGPVDGHLGFYASSATTCVIDNVSVKEAAVQCTQATGLDGIANTATTLTAIAADAIILQSITLASADRCASAYVKRRTGTGTISFTQDGGSTWTDVTAQINGSTWSRVQITSTLANPSVGFKISTSGNAIDVDCVQNEAGTWATSPIVTTTATVTRNAESHFYGTASNIDFAQGTFYCEIQSAGSTSSIKPLGLSEGSASLSTGGYSSWRANDGTTTTLKSTGMNSILNTTRKRAVSWGGAGVIITGDGATPVIGAFDGSYGSGGDIALGIGLNGYMRNVAIYNYQMTDAELQAITS